MNSDFKDLINEHCENCYYRENGNCYIHKYDMECIWKNLKCDLKELDNLREYKAKTYDKLLALEIIKEKRVNVDKLIHFIETQNEIALRTYNHYVAQYPNTRQLTQAEFDLLKEILL